jgi:hypothetical protein
MGDASTVNDTDSETNSSEQVVESTVEYTKEETYSPINTTARYQPIRLLAILTDDDSSGSKYLTWSQRQVLMEDMINPALYAWSQALHVVPVDNKEKGLTLDREQLFDGESCGPGLVRVVIALSVLCSIC